MAADLILHAHRRCPDIYADPDTSKIEALKPDAMLTLRRVSDLLRVPARDLDEFLDSGALKSTTDANGRTAIKASELQRFHAALRPVYFAQTDEDAGDDGDIDRDSATDEDTDTVPALTRRNPAEGDVTEESGGWVRLRLNDLVRLIRDGGAEDASETAPAASEPPAPSARY